MAGAVYVPVWELRMIIGRASADELLRIRGGTTIYVAAHPTEDSVIVRAIGTGPAERLASYYSVGSKHTHAKTSGVRLTLPLYKFGAESKRQRVMLELGGDPSRSTVEISRKMGVSERTVRRWRAKHRAIEAALYRDAAE